jgi:hypothetical protein
MSRTTELIWQMSDRVALVICPEAYDSRRPKPPRFIWALMQHIGDRIGGLKTSRFTPIYDEKFIKPVAELAELGDMLL